MAANERLVALNVRAKDEFSKVLKNLEEAGRKVQLQFMRDTRNSLKTTADEIKRVDGELRKMARASGDNRQAIADLVIQKGKLIERAGALSGNLKRITNAVRENGREAKGSFLAFSQMADSLRRVDVAADGATQALSAAVPVLNKKETSTRKAAAADREHAAAMDKASASARKMQGAMAAAGAAGARQRNTGKKGDAQEVEVYGLKPWQLTNLGYQVNDVISGLAMGQAPLQVFAQQAGQFAQIWPNTMVALARSIPVLLGVGAAMSPVIAALLRMKAETDTLRHFSSELALSADGANYTAQELTKAAMGMKAFGVSLKDARALVSGFTKQGIAVEDMGALAKMAKQLSAVTGMELPAAAQKLGKAFTGNISSVRELDRELNFLTAAQLEQLRAMEQSGDRAGALAQAQDILQQKLAATEKPTGTLRNAINDLKSAWDDLVDTFANSAILNFILEDFERGAQRIKFITGLIKSGAAALGGGDQDAERADLLSKQTITRDLIDRVENDPTIGGLFKEGQLEQARRELAVIEARLKEIEDATKAAADEQTRLNEQTTGVVAATEEQKKNASEVEAVVQGQVDAMQQAHVHTLLTSKEQFVQNALIDARNAALAKANELGLQFLGLTEEQTLAVRAQAGALYEAQQSAALQGNLGSFVNKVVSVESGGNPTAKNPNSTATGLGQFIESTWLAMFRKYFPDRAASMSEAAILALRKDAAMSKQMVELYAQENAKVLQSAGAAVNEASLYLAHFLGPNGAAKVMTAAASTPVAQLLAADQINANKSILAGKTAGEVRDWSARKMAVSPAEVSAIERINEIEKERADKAEQYNKGYAERIGTLRTEIEMQTMAAREAAIAKAIREEEAEAARVGLQLTQQQREEVARLTGDLFDRQNVDAEVNRLMEERGVILEKLKLAKENNDLAGVNAANGQLAGIDDALNTAIDKAIAFWQAMGGPGADLAIEKLGLMRQQLKDQSDEMTTRYLPSAEELNDRIANIGGSAFDKLAQAAAEGRLTFADFFSALRQGFGQLLVDIGNAIVKQAILNAIAGGTPGGGLGSRVGGWIASIFHDGGIVGSGAPSRMVNPAIFAGATRYHTGGIAGLKPNEVAIIAERNEEILTADDPRHRNNGGGAGANVKVINVLDPAEILEKALTTEVGEKAFVNFMARRKRQMNGVLG